MDDQWEGKESCLISFSVSFYIQTIHLFSSSQSRHSLTKSTRGGLSGKSPPLRLDGNKLLFQRGSRLSFSISPGFTQDSLFLLTHMPVCQKKAERMSLLGYEGRKKSQLSHQPAQRPRVSHLIALYPNLSFVKGKGNSTDPIF